MGSMRVSAHSQFWPSLVIWPALEPRPFSRLRLLWHCWARHAGRRELKGRRGCSVLSGFMAASLESPWWLDWHLFSASAFAWWAQLSASGGRGCRGLGEVDVWFKDAATGARRPLPWAFGTRNRAPASASWQTFVACRSTRLRYTPFSRMDTSHW